MRDFFVAVLLGLGIICIYDGIHSLVAHDHDCRCCKGHDCGACPAPAVGKFLEPRAN